MLRKQIFISQKLTLYKGNFWYYIPGFHRNANIKEFSCGLFEKLGQKKVPGNMTFPRHAPQRAKFIQKVHKPPLGVNVVHFELNGVNAFIWVPWSPSDPKKLSSMDRNIQIHRYVERNKMHFSTYSSISVKSLHRLA